MELLTFDFPGARRAVYAVAAALVVVAQIAILRTAGAYVKAAPSPDRRPTPLLEAFWAVAPAVALIAMLAYAWERL